MQNLLGEAIARFVASVGGWDDVGDEIARDDAVDDRPISLDRIRLCSWKDPNRVGCFLSHLFYLITPACTSRSNPSWEEGKEPKSFDDLSDEHHRTRRKGGKDYGTNQNRKREEEKKRHLIPNPASKGARARIRFEPGPSRNR